MSEIVFNKFDMKLSMWQVFLIYKSIADEFYHFEYKRALALLNDPGYIPDLNEEMSPEDEMLRHEFEGYFKPSYYDETWENRLLNNKCGTPKEIYIEKLFKLKMFVREFQLRLESENSLHSPVEKGIYYGLFINDSGFGDEVDNFKLASYYYNGYFAGKSIKYSLMFTNDGIKIEEEFNRDLYNAKSVKDILIIKSPKISFDYLEPIVKEYIEKHKKEKMFFMYSVSLFDEKEVINQEGKTLPQTSKEVEQKPKEEPLNQTSTELKEEERQEYKKNMLLQLLNLSKRDNNGEIPNGELFLINDYIFFSSITEEKREIDPFFKEHPEVLPYCNLSFINYPNADVRGFDFSQNPETIVILNEVYNNDVTGTNFENNQNLYNQSLKGIIARNANFKGTGITVPLDEVITVKDALFDNLCVFKKTDKGIDSKEAQCGGVIVTEYKTKLSLYLRQEAIRQQNITYLKENEPDENISQEQGKHI